MAMWMWLVLAIDCFPFSNPLRYEWENQQLLLAPMITLPPVLYDARSHNGITGRRTPHKCLDQNLPQQHVYWCSPRIHLPALVMPLSLTLLSSPPILLLCSPSLLLQTILYLSLRRDVLDNPRERADVREALGGGALTHFVEDSCCVWEILGFFTGLQPVYSLF